MYTLKSISILLLTLACHLAHAVSYEALVVSVSGTAFEVDANEQALRTLAPNATIAEGNGIRTAAGASLTIVLANGAVLTLEPESLVYMEQLQLDGDPSLIMNKPLKPSPANTRTRLRIGRGEILGQVKGLSPLSKFEVASPVGTAGITGTRFTIQLISLGGNRFSLLITNLDGSVTSPDGTAIAAGNQTVVTATLNTTTGEITDLVTTTETVPAATLEALIDAISDNVESIQELGESSEAPVIYLPIELIDPETTGDPRVVVIGTPT